MSDFLNQIEKEVVSVISEFLEVHPVAKGSLFVIGCSSSEVSGGTIGKDSSEEIGKVIFNCAYKILKKHGIYLACQCCEHLNRALVIEEECRQKFGYEEVSVVPWLKGGGSFATAAYNGFSHPVVVEAVQAVAGIDIGNTLIGMHLKKVAVPFRLSKNSIGNANIVCAYSRPKLIGGERARYN